ncbi:MAG: S9 family peptidase, partial [Myxococcales bacterium]|nr:S9 family peptidase [Myxococcales bacterium]
MDPLIPRSLLFGNPDRAQPRVSPDGAWLSWLAPHEGVLNVWVAPWDDPGAAQPVTADRQRGIHNHAWSQSSAFLLFEQDLDGDENFVLFAVPPTGGEPRQLTPSGARAQVIGTSPSRPDHLVVMVNDRVPELMDPVLVELRSGETTRLAENTSAVGFVVDRRDLSLRVSVHMTAEGGSLWRFLGEDGREEPVGAEDVLTTSLVGIDVDGNEWWLDSRGRDTNALIRVRGSEREEVLSHPRGDIADVMEDAGGRPRAAWAVFAEREAMIVDPAVSAHLERLATHREGTPVVTSSSTDDRCWVVGWHSSAGPVAYAAYDTASGRVRDLFLDRTALADQPLAERHPVVLRSRDGWDLVCYLTLPRWVETDAEGRPGEPLPMVLLVHGGPWWRDQPGYDGVHQLLANRGCATLSVNFRGSTGLGKRFLNAGDMEWGGKMHDDLLDAVQAMVERGVADPDRVAIMGGSYGGYATLVGLTFTPDTFACGVDIVGPSSLLTFMASIPPYWKPMKVQFHTRVGDDETEEGRAELWRRSPLSKVEQIRRPLLIAQGANDPRVKQAESDQLVAELQRREIPVTYALFPDEGHGF